MQKDEALEEVIKELDRLEKEGKFYTVGDCWILLKDIRKFIEALKKK